MKAGLYPKIAADGIRKNGRLYIPYFITCILMVALFYIMHMLGFSGLLKNFEGGSTASDMLRFGTYIMAVFGTIFLFYTQSTLVKGRLKEFGLYSVLGMNRKNLGRIVFFETLISWLIAMTGGLIAGIGLSKLARIVDTFARRPQLQERLTAQIADFLNDEMSPLGVAVVIEAEHLCMTMRGAKASGAQTRTSALRGLMRSDARTRSEAMSLLRGGNE